MQHQHATLPIQNLDCGGNTVVVERTLAAVPGVTQVYVNPATEMAYVEYDSALTNTREINAALARAGFGPAVAQPRVEKSSTSQQQFVTTLDARRLALAAGLLLMAIYLLCVAADLLFPQVFQMYRIWESILIGVRWTARWTLVLGLFETFFYGLIGGWALAALYNLLPASTPRQQHIR